MHWLTRLLTKLRFSMRRDRRNRELEEEMRFHRDQSERALVAEGVPADEARYAARRRFGNEVRLRDESQGVSGLWFESVLFDLRFALRQLRKNPGFAATAILILTLGIAASVAIFSFVDAALIQPLPYQNPSQLVVLFESIPLGPRFHLSYLDYLDWKRENTVFSKFDVYAPYGFMMQTPTGAQRVDGARVSAGFFRTLGVMPVLGRDFNPGEDQPSAARPVLLSYAAWQGRYGGRTDVLGQLVSLDGLPSTIVGVLPRDFHFAPAEPADFWGTERANDGGCEKNRGCHNLFGLARLKPGVNFATAFADVKSIAENLARQYPDSNRDQKAFMMTLADVIVGDIRPILLVLLTGAGLLLLVAAVNVSSLLLVRAERRRREMAVRGALGASRVRLVRQFVTEGMTLALSAGVLGLGVATMAMQLFLGLIPKDMLETMPYLRSIGLSGRVLLFAALISLTTGVLFSVLPALRILLADLRESLTEGGRGSSGTRWRRFGSNLVVVELAMAVVLLTGAGLLGKSFYRLLHTDIGLEPDHLATLNVGTAPGTYKKDEDLLALYRNIETRLKSLPGARSVALTSDLPLGDGDGTSGFQIIGKPKMYREVAYRQVSANYFSTIEARLVSGRYFAEDEDKTRPVVVVINQQAAKQYFPGEDPVGKLISLSDTGNFAKVQVAGVVNDIQEGQLDAAPRGAMYVPINQDTARYFNVVIRTEQSEDSILGAATATIHSVDPGLAVFEPISMSRRLHDSPSAALHRSSAWVVGGFAALALLLSVVGLYGVIAYSVSQRTREIGVRMALGAQRGAVSRMILREAGGLALLGIGAGLVCSLAAATLLRKLLFHVASWDPATLVAVAVVLGGAALVASWLPARRAASVNPTEALHAE